MSDEPQSQPDAHATHRPATMRLVAALQNQARTLRASADALDEIANDLEANQ